MPSFGSLNRVNTNLQSMEARFSLNKINRDLADNQIKLATGLRINRAEDDAAGFSIASKLSSRIGGLEQALRNVGDAKSVLDIAESSMNNVMDILIEMKAKAVQGANGILGTDERGYIQAQIDDLAAEIDNIASQTTFQGTSLLSGTSMVFQVGEASNATLSVSIATVSGGVLGVDGLAGSATTDFRDFIDVVDSAITTLSGVFNEMGIVQNSLSIREETLSQQITSNSSARGSIMDTDFAQAQSESIRLQILQQTATAALAQANMGPQAVLNFIQ